MSHQRQDDGDAKGRDSSGRDSSGRVGVRDSSSLRRGLKAALARWVLRKRRGVDEPQGGARRSGGHSFHEEATHPWDGRRRYAEDYTFVGVESDTAIMTRLEWLPGRASHRVWVMVFRAGGVWALEGGQAIVRGTGHDRWRAGGLVIDCETPFRRWSIKFSGHLHEAGEQASSGKRQRCSLDLVFETEAAPFWPGPDDDPDLMARRLGAATWDASLLREVRRVQNRGYVQTGRLAGTLVLGDALIGMKADCLREHTWGIRDFGASDRAFHCFVALADGRRAWVHRAEFPFLVLEGGFVELSHSRETVRSVSHREASDETANGAPILASLGLDHATGYLRFDAEFCSSLDLTVDGRGQIRLGLFRLADGSGFGFWGGQRRVLPRP